MAPSARRIPKEEWDRVKHVFHDLHYVRGIPVHKKGGGESVQKILETEHDFKASRAQFDEYKKSLGQPVNLKKHEWRIVHKKLDELVATDAEVRVRLSGKVLSEARLHRSKQHAFSGPGHSHPGSAGGHALPHPNSLVIETRRADGAWSIHTGGPSTVRTAPSPTTNRLAILETQEEVIASHSEDFVVHHSNLDVVSPNRIPTMNGHSISALEAQPMDYADMDYLSPRSRFSTLSRHDLNIFPSFASPLEYANFGNRQPSWGNFDDWPNYEAFTGPFLPQEWAQESPFLQLRTAVEATSTRDSHPQSSSVHYPIANGGQHTAAGSLAPLSSKNLVLSLLQDATQVLTTNSMPEELWKLPDPNDVLDRLLSLLPENISQDNSEATGAIFTKDPHFDSLLRSPFYSAILYSIANGFAGLRDIPPGAILIMLRKQHHMSSRIIECLRSSTFAQAKCLADNLFRAAVEACDEEVVRFILDVTRDSPNAIDPNDIVCKLNDSSTLLTPIELAAKFRHLGIVKLLLAANADVNKTYQQLGYKECGALENAIRMQGTFETVDMNLVLTLLRNQAKVRVGLIGASIRGGQVDLVRELITRLPPVSHKDVFRDERMLIDAAEFLENDLATYTILRMFEYCKTEACLQCSMRFQQNIQYTLETAVRRGNFALVELLLPRTANLDGALAAAVRRGSQKLIELFLLKGATVNGSPRDLYRVTTRPWDKGSPTTPLAEAIRSRDRDVVLDFEARGALACMSKSLHFEAAVSAAAEVEDLVYMKKLLQLVPEGRGKRLTIALKSAIRNDHTEAALVLLDSGADVDSKQINSALCQALQKQNRVVVDAILEADINLNSSKSYFVMKAAGRWGDVPVIEDLIFMGASADAALTEAVKSKDNNLITLLLAKGASPSTNYGGSPLAAAIENEDTDTIQLLLSSGADPASTAAMRSALKRDRKTFDTLLRAFSSRYPNGKLNFGGSLLIIAIQRGDTALLDSMLAAKFDVHDFSPNDDETAALGFGMVREKTVFDFAEVDELTALGFAIMHRKGAGTNLTIIRQLIDRGGANSIDFRRSKSHSHLIYKTALLIAVETRSEHIVEFLLQNGADVHRSARRGLKRTPLQRACEIGSFKIVKLLLDHGADVNEQPADRGGATALQLAAISGSIKVAELLMRRGAMVHAAPAKVGGRTAFEGAAEHGCVDMIKVLWDATVGVRFTPEQIAKAKDLAISKGHQGCAKYIGTLWVATNVNASLLDFDMLISTDQII